MHGCGMQRLTASYVQVAAWRQHLKGLTIWAALVVADRLRVPAPRVWVCAAVRCRAGGMAVSEGQPVYEAPLYELS